MTESQGIEITTRPFIGDLLSAPSTPVAPAPTTQPDKTAVRENTHLLAAVVGTAPDPVPAPAEPLDVQPTLRQRARARGVTEAVQSPTTATAHTQIEATGHLLVDWDLVVSLTKELSVDSTGEGSTRSRGSFDVATASAEAETEEERLALEEIDHIIERHSTKLVQARGSDKDMTPIARAHYRQAIFDQAFRYGRLQSYLRESDVEDISVVGSTNVVVTKTDGTRSKRPPIAQSDDDLEKMIADIATFRGRTFARPGGYLDLDIGGARLSATGTGITSVTNLTIRKHNLVEVDLNDLVKSGTISSGVYAFLTAAAQANLCIMVAGFPGTGKTTMLRALMSKVRPEEKIVTIETERELYLNKLPARHWQVQDLQYVPPQYAGGDSAAGFSLEKCLEISLRSSAERILFAEIRGAEGPIAIKAMQAGKGSMSTIHARSADDAIHRFADVLMSEQGLSDDTVPLRQIMRSIDVILYIDFVYNADGTRRRVVTEVTEVIRNDSGLPMASKLFEYGRESGSYEKPEKLSVALAGTLHRVGYDHERAQRGES